MNEPVLLVIDVGNTNVALGVYDYQNGESTLSQHGHALLGNFLSAPRWDP